MKKVLFATTALVASAGFAAADITFSGSAEMGIVGGGKDAPGVSTFVGNGDDSTTEFNNDFTLTVVGSGQTDSGLSFGISVDFSTEAEPNANGNVTLDNEAVFISGDFGTLTLGEIDGAVDKRLTEAHNAVGQYSIGDDETVHAGYQGSYGDAAYDNQILRYDYAFGDFGFSASMELNDDDSGTDDADNGYALAISYNTDMGGVGLGFGLGYQYLEAGLGGWAPGNLEDYTTLTWAAGTEVDIIAATVSADFNNGFKAGFEYSNYDPSGAGNSDIDHYAVGLGYTMDALSVGVSYGKFEADIGDADGWALTAAYDLGGGAAIVAGYSDSDVDNVDGDFETYSLGVAMSF
ncbi:porin [Rhodovulum visakhapatnamense]|uniref:Outer membrane protein OmpU n=1 Tax=Rhodovulum visakhapatnamense TaxID=364297 RepID=A0A4R8G5P8_9RHOB|nr:porin [Rhodovulum visakhapatnamense]TDX31890.1 outer membrane protein OmpU [Rhodovulum visakhapatnamense]